MKKIITLCAMVLCSLNGMAQPSSENPLKGFSMTDGFNAIELAHQLSSTNDFDKSKEYILSTSSLAFKKDYENKNFLSADRTEGMKERFWMSRDAQNNSSLKVNISVSKWTDNDIIGALTKLGYTEISSRESHPFGIYNNTQIYKNSTTSTEAELIITKKNNKIKKEITFKNTSNASSGKEANFPQVAQKEKEETNKNTQSASNTSTLQPDSHLPKVNEKKFKVKNVEFSMRFVPHGTFTMGKGNNTVKVELTNDYWVSETEVTTGLYDAVMETTIGGNGQMAVTCSWLTAMEFIRRLNIITGMNFRMITEAEWEYAARYGNGKKKYSGGDKPEEVLNTREVKDSQKDALNKPNFLGIYGMSNRTAEWCYDIYKEKYPSQPQRNYQGPKAEDMKGNEHNHVVRSGGAMYYRQNSDVDLYDRISVYEKPVHAGGIRLALYDKDIKNKVPQAIEKRKVNLPAGMPIRWRGTGTLNLTGKSKSAIKATIYIKNERHHLTHIELEGKIGYGYVYLGETNDKGLYIIDKIVITGKNTFTITIVPKDGGQHKQLSLTYEYKTSTWKLLKCKSSFKIFNDASFTYDRDFTTNN